ncbi:MAG TPA: D-2-hydroxyacid dehydrogenase [Symbiobacteriaceae bacterium]|nr:D-2-hydroxyacid dehydrogenase [Symbiobacteriaceae bacterium]
MNILVQHGGEFALWDRHFQRIAEAAPGADVRVIPAKEVTREDVLAADIIFGFPKKDWVAEAPNLKWIQLPSAGSDGWHQLRPDVLLTKASGVFGVPIAEWVLAGMLMLTRNLHLYRDLQKQNRWEERPGAAEIFGSTVGIVGLGNIGEEVAVRARAFGCRVLGARRTAGAPVPFVDAVLPLDELLPQVDFLVLAIPNTPETRGIISAERLAALKPGSYLINVGRGATVDEEALVAALQSGHLAGAALDVTTVEPLPATSPLWQMEQVIISPHTSGRSPSANGDRRTEIFCENLKRFFAGQTLMNLVDRQAGY